MNFVRFIMFFQLHFLLLSVYVMLLNRTLQLDVVIPACEPVMNSGLRWLISRHKYMTKNRLFLGPISRYILGPIRGYF